MNNLPVDLYYEELGQGTPLVFVHGFPLDHTAWLSVARLLKDKARCILPDMRGFGKSPVTRTETTILDMATDIIRLLDRLEIQQAVVTGHSMGGYISVQMAYSFPDRVTGLGLVASRPVPDSSGQAAARMESREDVLKNGSSAFISNMASRLTENKVILPEIMAVMEKTNPRGIAMAQYAMVHRLDAMPWLETVTFPIVVVAGSKDKIIPEKILKDMVRHLKNGKYYSSPTAFHMIPIEDPGLIARAIVETFNLEN